MIRFPKLLCVLMLLLACGARAVTAGDAIPADAILGFADALLAEGEYYRAITEYKRAIYMLGPRLSAPRARAVVGIGRAYFLGGDYARACDWLRGRRFEYQRSNTWGAGEPLLLRALLRVGEYDEAARMAGHHPGPEGGFYAGLVEAYGRRWDAARERFASVPADQALADPARWNAQIVTAAARAGYKRPAVAGALAVLPGLGYLYAGHPQSALAALFMNALLITGSAQALRAEQYALGSLATFLALTWYAGNIYGSVHAAERYNDRMAEEFLAQLRE